MIPLKNARQVATRALVEEDGDEIAGALISNPELAQLAGQLNLQTDKDGIFWVNLINDRPELQELMAKVSYSRDPDEIE